METKTTITLVSTVLNDRSGCLSFFEQIMAQTLMPDEVILVDGGSSDGTWEWMLEVAQSSPLPFRVFQEKGCNVARGRNLAIEAARSEIIASTDIGCALDPEWLEELVAPFRSNPETEVVIGSWAVPKEWAQTPWAKTEFAYRPSMQLEATPQSQGTSRSIAYRKSAWTKIGGYPEDLTLAADDTCFDLLIKKHRLVSAAAPKIRCYWHRHGTLSGFLKEQHRYFFGDGEAAIRHMHFSVVGGRLGLEFLGAPIGGALLFSSIPGMAIAGSALLSAALVSMLQRVLRLRPSAKRLKAEGVDRPWMRLIAFEYLTKLVGLKAYLQGYFSGLATCSEIRRRLCAPDVASCS